MAKGKVNVPKELRGFVAKNLTPILDYWEISNGVMFLKDGGVEFGIEIYPRPDAYLDEEARERVAEAFHKVVIALPDGARLRYYYESQKATLEAVRGYLQSKRNRAPMIQRMVWERAKLQVKEALRGRRLRWTAKLLVHLPSLVTPSTGNTLKDFWFQVQTLIGNRPKAQVFTPLYEGEYSRLLARVDQLRGAILGILEEAGVSAQPMSDDAIYSMIFRWLNRDPLRTLPYEPTKEFYTEEEVRREGLDPATLRRRVAQTPLWATAMNTLYKKPYGTPPGEGEEHIAIYELTYSPKEGFWSAIPPLLAATPMAVVVDIYKRPQEETKLSLSRAFVRKFRASRAGDAPEASDITQEGVLLQALTRAETGEAFVDFSMSVVVRADRAEELESLLRTYEGTIGAPRFGGGFRRLKENLAHPYLNLLPFSGKRQEARFLTLSRNSALFLANAGPWNREGQKPYPMVVLSNRYLGIAPIDLFEKRARSWNTIVVGSTGSGKTFTALYLLSEAVADDPETEIIIVDKKGDYAPWVEMMGGSVVDIAPESGVTVNMFDLDTTFFQERPHLPGEEKLGFLQKMFYVLFNRPDDPNLALKEQLWLEAVRLAYEAKVETAYDEHGREVGYTVVPPTLQQVVDTIRSLDAVGRNALTDEQKMVARQLATELSSWLTGPMARFLNGQTNLKGENDRIVYFNFQGIDRLESSLYMALALALIAERIYGRLNKAPRHVKKFIIFDEAHALFKIKEAAAMVVDLYRRARSYGAAVWTLTQTIAEYRGAYVEGMIQTTNFFIFVNSKGQGKDISEILNLPEAVGRSAETLQRQKGVFNELLYIMYEEGGRIEGDIFRLYPTPWDYWLFTSSHEEVARREALRKQFGGDLYKAIQRLAQPNLEEDRVVEALLRGATDAAGIEALLKGKVPTKG